MRPTPSLNFQFDTEFLLDTDPEESCLKTDTAPEMSHGCHLITPENNPKDLSARIKRRVLSKSSEDELSCQEDLMDTVRSKEESLELTVNDFTTPVRKIESYPLEVAGTPICDQFSPLTQGNLLSYIDHFEEIDFYAENKSSEPEDKDRSATITLSEDFEDVLEKFLSVPEQDTELIALTGREEQYDEQLEDETAHDEKFLVVPEEFAASPQRSSAPRKDRMNRRRRTSRNCRSASTTSIVPAVTSLTCSVNYQSEVEQEPVLDEVLEVSIPAPPPFLFYQRKKRTEIGSDGVVPEPSFSTNTGSIRALRPRRSSSAGDTKLAPGRPI